MAPLVNVWVDGVWYGPNYPDAGDPPAEQVDPDVFDGPDEVAPVDGEAVTTAEQAAAFGSPGDPVETDAQGSTVPRLEGPDPVAPTVHRDDPDESAPAAAPAAGDAPPPRRGRGSSAPVWRAYARTHGVDVADDAERDDVIAACEAAGVRVD